MPLSWTIIVEPKYLFLNRPVLIKSMDKCILKVQVFVYVSSTQTSIRSLKASIRNVLQPLYIFDFVLPLTSWLFKDVTIKLWWLEIPTWMTSKWLNSSFLVRIRSMQDWFSGWRQVDLFIKHSRLKVFIKVSRFLSSVVKL